MGKFRFLPPAAATHSFDARRGREQAGKLDLSNEARMRYFLDAEFNGFGGGLISIALVAADRNADAFYEVLPCAKPDPWVLDRAQSVLQKQPISRPAMTAF